MARIRMKSAQRLGLGAATLLFLSAAPSWAADITGVWMIVNPSAELKTVDGATPPLTKDAATTYEKHRAQFKSNDLSFDPVSRCISPGMPRILSLPYPFKIFQNDRHVFFSFQWNRWFRYARLDKKLDPPYPMSMGTAVGRWEGEELVIDTEGLRSEDSFLDAAGMPHSEALHIQERLRLVSPDVLEDRIKVTDPQTFTKSWETVLRFKRQPAGTEISEDVCFDRTEKGEPAVGLVQ